MEADTFATPMCVVLTLVQIIDLSQSCDIIGYGFVTII